MILHGDCLDKLKELEDNSIDQLVTDPPYGINFMGKSWDNFEKGQEKAQDKINKLKKDGKTYHLEEFDRNHPIYKFEGMIEFFTPIWKEVYRVLKPGSFGFIMCIPRQDCLSRMMISLEDAGFNINFSSIYWTYATGFPKAMNIGKKIDKRLGKERKVVGKNTSSQFIETGNKTKSEARGKSDIIKNDYWGHGVDVTKPSSSSAKQMEGSYAGFQPKPAVEVIIVVMKPLSEKSYIDQAMKYGKGVTWFDDCRIPYKDEGDEDSIQNKGQNINKINKSNYHSDQDGPGIIYQPSTNGRFPANLLVSDDILDDDKDHASIGNFKAQVGKGKYGGTSYFESKTKHIKSDVKQESGGGYSRFFSLDAWAERNLPFLIVPKAAKKEKNLGVDCESEDYVCENCGNRLMICFAINKCDNCGGKKVKTNVHPTVKPMKLMSYLITMGSRPGDTIIDPFAGSGTVGCAAVTLNRKYILIEKETEYIKIINARLKYWSSLPLTC